MYLIVHSCK